jgi:hypothetical protein
MGELRNAYKILAEKSEGNKRLGKGADGRMISKWMSVAGSCEHGNEHSGFIKILSISFLLLVNWSCALSLYSIAFRSCRIMNYAVDRENHYLG